MKKFLLSMMLVTSLLFGSAAVAAPAYASSTDAARKEVCRGVSGAGTTCNAGGADLNRIVRAVLNIMSVIAGLAAVIMIIISGLKYITSSGEAQEVSSAKRTLIYAIVGLIVVALAQIIVRFVITRT